MSQQIGDLISRQAVLDLISRNKEVLFYTDTGYGFIERSIKGLSSVKMSGDAISRQAVLGILNNFLLDEEEMESVADNIMVEIISRHVTQLPPVNPQELRIGHWIDDKCSICGMGIEDLIESHEWYYIEPPIFCPFCGARMAESEDKDEM